MITYEFVINLLNANWSVWLLAVIILVILVEYNHKNDISALISRVSLIKWGENQFGFDTKMLQMNQEPMASNTEGNNDEDINDIRKKYKFEVLYNVIYRSQLMMMTFIKDNNNNPMPYQFAINFFIIHKNFIPSNNLYNIEQYENSYFNWLVIAGLIKQSSSNSFTLTEFGIEFLTYIYRRNYDVNFKLG